ncbi:PIN domain-containing protein [Cyclonatronum proteinivorum]|uniref:PIN domain-containing protein n=1 Tax=Cyclonatronum proteinivorum TaxID=1457365 RepID=A0A345UFW1_9BACT|nr:type II toxin-antitoxin system VapC family toxin [Cyclonatronum proteinivorum]AXI99362.1 PIN domain-containing protein [Cyclonatronum proteinivorum]
MKSTIYIETSFISYLTSRASRDLVTAARQQLTQEWWEKYRKNYSLYISQAVLAEAGSGDSIAAKRRLHLLNRIPTLVISDEARIFAEFLVKETPFPPQATVDALHIAVASVHKVDFIITWNFRHIANASIRSKLEVLAQSKKLSLPTICTPEELRF